MWFLLLWFVGFVICCLALAWCVQIILDTYVGRKEL